MIWVLDASVAIKWFFVDEPRREHALRVREHLASNPHGFIVPHLFLSEMIHVLARKSGRAKPFVSKATTLLLRLGLRTLALDEEGWRDAAQWSTRGLSGYDATYLALAGQLGGLWLTDDEAAARRTDRAVALREWHPD